jgi:uncharacterized protein (TIGR00661 family)
MKRVLVAPLDWGLGHATRCIPVIQELLEQNCEVVLAGNGPSIILLQKEFPSLMSFPLPGYDPEYSVTASMVSKMAMQLPKFFLAARAEHMAMKKIVQDQNIDLIISDNRYGCWSNAVPSVLITHQSNILMPRRFGWLGPFVRLIVRNRIRKFTSCWIPDFPDNSLSGLLTAFGKADLQTDVTYIGPLSRFKPSENLQKKYDVAAIFSGPEPQRTIMENMVVPQLEKSSINYFVVRGLPQCEQIVDSKKNVVNFMTTEDLKTVIESAELVISRSGYSTVMDLAALGKKAIFIPTPGQTEQEYLARELKRKKIAYSIPQEKFDLRTALEETHLYSGFQRVGRANELLKKAIKKVIG